MPLKDLAAGALGAENRYIEEVTIVARFGAV
jgi:hypothetical protein